MSFPSWSSLPLSSVVVVDFATRSFRHVDGNWMEKRRLLPRDPNIKTTVVENFHCGSDLGVFITEERNEDFGVTERLIFHYL